MPLTDGDRIRGLLGTYCHLIDAGDFAGVGRLMADAVLMTDDGTVIATGADEVTALYAGLVRLHDDGTPGTQHLVANTVLEDSGGDGTVRATSSYVVFQAVADLPLQPIVTGTYVDTLDTDSTGRWRFRERRFGIGRSGTLHHHLAPGVIA
jgi:hypothetical protein